MKKVVKILALSFVVVALAAACKNNNAEPVDTMNDDTVVMEDSMMVVDSAVVDEPVVDEPVVTKPAKTKKKSLGEELGTTTVKTDDGTTIQGTTNGNKMQRQPDVAKETTTTQSDGTTMTTNNSGKMKRTSK